MIIKTKFKDLFIFKNKLFKDKRGYFKELIVEKKIKKKLPFTVMSYSKKDVLNAIKFYGNCDYSKYLKNLISR